MIFIEIYLKQKEKIVVNKNLTIRVCDLCDTIVFDNKIKNIVIYRIPKDKYKHYVVTSIDITKKILDYNRDLSINMMGPTETIIEYKKKKKKK